MKSKKHNVPLIAFWIFEVILILGGLYIFYKGFDMRLIALEQNKADPNATLLQAWKGMSIAYMAAGSVIMISVWLGHNIENGRMIQQQTIDRLNWTIERIAEVEASKHSQRQEGEGKWPWGSHHTDALGHLEAAANRFWTLYDPMDPSTAPTNEMVAGWLRDERRVSREKANAIASILRADGLKTGPRR
ncbi:hypothetical protein [Acidovorax sp. KKS102]|uniref:hypothetical protein n=1 Tax=Acidovorax sp. KKS102 TaxID=358220 RepID=UPI001930BB17|nr:hypothetical protein [Acidovorax sp. KKS102]